MHGSRGEKRKILSYLVRTIMNYLGERYITVKDCEGGIYEIKLTSDVPQRSVLGPTL